MGWDWLTCCGGWPFLRLCGEDCYFRVCFAGSRSKPRHFQYCLCMGLFLLSEAAVERLIATDRTGRTAADLDGIMLMGEVKGAPKYQ